MFLDHTRRRTTVGRTTLDEWSARRRDLYLTTHNTTGIGWVYITRFLNCSKLSQAYIWPGQRFLFYGNTVGVRARVSKPCGEVQMCVAHLQAERKSASNSSPRTRDHTTGRWGDLQGFWTLRAHTYDMQQPQVLRTQYPLDVMKLSKNSYKEHQGFTNNYESRTSRRHDVRS